MKFYGVVIIPHLALVHDDLAVVDGLRVLPYVQSRLRYIRSFQVSFRVRINYLNIFIESEKYSMISHHTSLSLTRNRISTKPQTLKTGLVLVVPAMHDGSTRGNFHTYQTFYKIKVCISKLKKI